jgi:cathepsin D
MSFGGRSWSISPVDFAMTRISSDRCIGGFFVLDSTTPAWIIGDTFLVSLCSPFLENASYPHLRFPEKRLLRVQV